MLDIARGDSSGAIEVDSNEFSEAGGVVVSDGLCITESLQHGIGPDDLVFERDLLLLLRRVYAGASIGGLLLRGSDGGEIRNDLLGVLGLSRTGLTLKSWGLIDRTSL